MNPKQAARHREVMGNSGAKSGNGPGTCCGWRLSAGQITAALKGHRDKPGKAAAIQAELRAEHLGQSDLVASAYAATVTATVAVLRTRWPWASGHPLLPESSAVPSRPTTGNRCGDGHGDA
ncbi:hypothetical protein [Nonomuraea candida]|uniref:hypothetical protein n=1 Tax=Nonomuraea candida TaxID=359159 RepID=UPI001B80AC2A|nr:hypothetical protein [Nonomuraea candida]